MSIDLRIDNLTDAEVIGRGGFGTVYSARDLRFERRVAVKVLSRLSSDRDRAAFERECRIMGRMSAHPNVVTVHEAGFSRDDNPYLIMELIKDGSLAQRLQSTGPLPWLEAVGYAVPVADALNQGHDFGIEHRDVKPDNILMAGAEPRLTDFGIARLRDATGSTSTQITASWLHASPETFENKRDHRSDIYSLVSTLQTLITGVAPFYSADDESLSPLMFRLLTQPPPRLPTELGPTELADLLQQGLSKDPADRPQSARDLMDGLRQIASRHYPKTVSQLAPTVAAYSGTPSTPTTPKSEALAGSGRPPIRQLPTPSRPGAEDPTLIRTLSRVEPRQPLEAPMHNAVRYQPRGSRNAFRWIFSVLTVGVIVAGAVVGTAWVLEREGSLAAGSDGSQSTGQTASTSTSATTQAPATTAETTGQTTGADEKQTTTTTEQKKETTTLPTVPDVVGKTATNAEAELSQAGFEVKRGTKSLKSNDKNIGVVAEQSPTSGPSSEDVVIIYVGIDDPDGDEIATQSDKCPLDKAAGTTNGCPRTAKLAIFLSLPGTGCNVKIMAQNRESFTAEGIRLVKLIIDGQVIVSNQDVVFSAPSGGPDPVLYTYTKGTDSTANHRITITVSQGGVEQTSDNATGQLCSTR